MPLHNLIHSLTHTLIHLPTHSHVHPSHSLANSSHPSHSSLFLRAPLHLLPPLTPRTHSLIYPLVHSLHFSTFFRRWQNSPLHEPLPQRRRPRRRYHHQNQSSSSRPPYPVPRAPPLRQRSRRSRRSCRPSVRSAWSTKSRWRRCSDDCRSSVPCAGWATPSSSH